MVYVLDRRKIPLMPCSEKRARLLLDRGRATVHRMVPFTIRLKDRTVEQSELQPLRLKLDPGTEFTGAAVMRNSAAIGFYEVHHRTDIKKKLDTRRILRRSRRSRKTRYRPPRFLNRNPALCTGCGSNAARGRKMCRICQSGHQPVSSRRDALPPSMHALVNQTVTWVEAMRSRLPLTALSVEVVKFDTKAMAEAQNADYDPKSRAGYTVREYLLTVFEHQCVYCRGLSNDPALNVDHLVPRHPSHGPRGSNKLPNLVVACVTCNKAKGNLQPDEWLAELARSRRPVDGVRRQQLARIVTRVRQPLHNAAAMNMTRLTVLERLRNLGLDVEIGYGADTKYNRVRLLNLPKTHYYDAVAVGTRLPESINTTMVEIHSAVGRGSRQMSGVDRHGFPWRWREHTKSYYGFQTGDLVFVEMTKGKYQGRWRGRVAARKNGWFDVKDQFGRRICQGISYRNCRLLQRANGWDYSIASVLNTVGRKQ